MANIIEIETLSAEGLEVYSRLKDAQLRACREGGLFIAESTKVISYALDAGYTPVSLLMEKRCVQKQAAEIISRCADIPIYTAERARLAELTGYELTRGVLCAMKRRALPAPEEICAGAERIAVLENIADPTNVGALFRSAAALGMDALLLTENCCDALYRRAVRVSMGTVFQIPWTRIGPDWPERLCAMGFKTAALALDSRAVSIENEALRKEKRLALVIGSEGLGLKAETIEKCDCTVIIPMAHGVDSLNAAAAGAVAFWQLRAEKYR